MAVLVAALTTQQAYLKASDTKKVGRFGYSVAVSGNTAVVGGIGDSDNNGAVYVFVRNGGVWTQQQKLTASNAEADDQFGVSVAIAGETIVVGASFEAGGSDRVNGNQTDNSAPAAGAAYVFTRSGVTWSQQAYLKASNSDAGDLFGYSVAIAGETIVVGALFEASSSDGVNGNQTDNSAPFSGAAYVFARSGAVWSQQAYLKASNSDAGDEFGGLSVAIFGETIVIGENGEDSGTSGVNSTPSDTGIANDTGAAHVFTFPVSSQSAVKVKFNTKLGNVIGAGSYTQGSSVTLTAKPKKGKKFLGWYEGKKLLSKKKKLTLTNLAKNRNLIAKFK